MRECLPSLLQWQHDDLHHIMQTEGRKLNARRSSIKVQASNAGGGFRQSYSRRFSLRDFFKIRGSKEQSKATLLDPILAVGPAVFEYAEAIRVTRVSMPCAASLQSRRLLRGCECGRFQSCGSTWELPAFSISSFTAPSHEWMLCSEDRSECEQTSKKEIPHIWNESSDSRSHSSVRLSQRWSRFVRQAAKVDLLTKRMIHHEDTQTVHG
jgi:hypothetical protein